MKDFNAKKIMAQAMIICLTASAAFAQSIDQKKMDKDIAIAENILVSLMVEDPDNMYYISPGPKGIYVPDYGVIFNLSSPAHPILERLNLDWDDDFDFDFDFDFEDSFVIDTKELNKKAQIIARESQRIARESQRLSAEEQRMMEELEREAEDLEREAEELAKKAEKQSRIREKKLEELKDEDVHTIRSKNVIVKGDKVKILKEMEMDYKPLMTDFLINYASLIGQLKPNQKVMISSGKDDHRYGRDKNGEKVTAEIKKSDLEAYRSGKLNEEQIKSKIVFSEMAKSMDEKDLELVSSIFKRLYKSDLSETYYISGGVGYERLQNFGVIYSMKMYSSNSHRGKYSMPTLDLDGLSKEERNTKVQELYPKFENELKDNVLEYGRTIRSLGANETVLFQVKLTECNSCEMPENIDVSVKQSVLADFNSGKLSKSAALAKVNVKKYNE